MGNGDAEARASLDRPPVVRFGEHELDRPAGLLRGPEGPVRLPPRVYSLLDLLVSKPGQLVTKEEILSEVWHDAFVEEGSVNRAVSTLRRALGDDGAQARFVETVPRRGYRFVATVVEGSDAAPAPSPVSDREPPVEERGRSISEALPSTGASLPAARTRALRWLVAGGLVVTVALPAGLALRARQRHEPPTLAVLPFVVSAGTPQDVAMGVGLADRVIARLSPSLGVRPLSATLAFGQPGRDAAAAGRLLGAAFVLDATLQTRSDGAAEASLTLVHVASGSVRLSFREPVDSLDATADRLGTRLLVALGEADPGIGVPPRYTRSSEAYALYLEARQLWNLRASHTPSQVIRLLRSALELDPNFALAHAALADQLVFEDYQTGSFREAETLAERALQIDPTLGEAWASIGFSKLFHRWDPKGAEEALRRAQRLSPRYATAPQWLATCLAVQGRLFDSMAAISLAMELDPGSQPILLDGADIWIYAGNLSGALGFARKAEEHAGWRSRLKQIEIAMLLRDFAEVRRLDGPLRSIGCAETPAGPADVAAFGRRVVSSDCSLHLTLFHRAAWAAWAGNRAGALDLLEKARDEHHFFTIYAGVDPRFASLKGDPRYEAVLRSVGLGR